MGNKLFSQDLLTEYIDNGIHYLLHSVLGAPEELAAPIRFLFLLLFIAVIALLIQGIFQKILKIVFTRLKKNIPLNFFKYTIPNKLPQRVALIMPYSFLRGTMPVLFSDFDSLLSPMTKLLDVLLIFVVISAIMAVLKSFANGLQEKPAFRGKPMKSYLQVIQIILSILGAVVMFSIITDKSVAAIFAALGAASAITMLIFKDSIMGFVSSIQLTTNDMVKLGDWITMPKHGADGNVVDISLTTVKVENFDKTITTIPTYSLISDSFQNWRNMEQSGGRRIKRPLYIKQDTIRFLTKEELDKYKESNCLRSFIESKEKEYALLNKGVSPESEIGAHRLSNSELFIAYASHYLQNHPGINQDMKVTARQRSATTSGVEIEVYVFSKSITSDGNEALVSEIFGHLISVTKHFKLSIFENSSGSDDYNVFLTQKS